MKLNKISLLIALFSLYFGAIAPVTADLPQNKGGVTVIHLDEYSGYFAAAETLASLKAGEYEFVVNNKSGKLVGFQIQNFKTHKTLDMFPLEPGETRSSRISVTTDGVRFRCPINPTAWYDLDNIAEAK